MTTPPGLPESNTHAEVFAFLSTVNDPKHKQDRDHVMDIWRAVPADMAASAVPYLVSTIERSERVQLALQEITQSPKGENINKETQECIDGALALIHEDLIIIRDVLKLVQERAAVIETKHQC